MHRVYRGYWELRGIKVSKELKGYKVLKVFRGY